MNKSNQATQKKESRSFTQEMHQAFTDWVNRLPFIKKDIAYSPEREDLEDESSDKAPDKEIDDGSSQKGNVP
jgi:hypothetical protein